MTAQPHLYPIEITCPTTGRPITVMKSVRGDPVALLYVTNQITPAQMAAVDAYRADHEGLSGSTRAASNGPSDLAWRGRRQSADRTHGHRKQLDHVAKVLGREQLALVEAAAIHGQLDERQLKNFRTALDALQVAYGLATPTRH